MAGASAILPDSAHAQAFGDANPAPLLAQRAPVSDALPVPVSDALPVPVRSGRIQLAALTPPVASLPPRPTVSDVDASPRSACLEAVRGAEAAHDLPEGLLVAIALNESTLHAYALSLGGRSVYPATRAEAERLYRGARGAVMAGCLQVNARVHARNDTWPLDPERAADWAGYFLRDAYARSGSWAEAVRIWHGGRPGTATQLACRIRAKMDVTAPHSGLFRDRNCGSAGVARLRSNGLAHMEVAQAATAAR